VTWHDGEPFTANDVKFTWELIAHPDNTTAAQLYAFFSTIAGADAYHTGKAEEITGIKVVDDTTLDVTLDSPWAPFLTIGTHQYIVPRHILGEIEVGKILESDYARAPIGTGPFTFKAWQTGDSIIGEAFEGYYAGRPAADQVVLRVALVDDNTKITAFTSGELNFSTITLDGYDSIGDDDPDIAIIQTPGRANQYLEFNLAKPIFADLKVRKALSFATKRQDRRRHLPGAGHDLQLRLSLRLVGDQAGHHHLRQRSRAGQGAPGRGRLEGWQRWHPREGRPEAGLHHHRPR
jgi:peptide/nickel transport system substrate-binding protein